MTNQIKEGNFSIETKEGERDTKEHKTKRPNIDHLIKRIMVEKKKEQKKNIIIFAFIVLIIIVIVSFNL
tara:strand:- start:431 stop:637 length:207 start_codon:yes stop_codon:yes gene_type:complete